MNPDVSAETHPYIATGQGGIKFGVPFDQVLPLARIPVAVAHLLSGQLRAHRDHEAGIARQLQVVRGVAYHQRALGVGAELRGALLKLSAALPASRRNEQASARERVQVMKLAWDAVAGEFGGRQEIYEIFFAGDPFLSRQLHYFTPRRWRRLRPSSLKP